MAWGKTARLTSGLRCREPARVMSSSMSLSAVCSVRPGLDGRVMFHFEIDLFETDL